MAKQLKMIYAVRAILRRALLMGLALSGFMVGTNLAQGQQTCAYVNDNLPNGNTVEGYSVTGTTAHVGPVATGGSGSLTNDSPFIGTPLIAIAPGTNHLYASDSGSNDIALFDIDSSTCNLTLVANFPAEGSSLFGLGIAISPDGKFLYAINADRRSTLVVFAINSDGSLGNSVQTVSLPANPLSLAATPNGKFLIVTLPTTQNQVQSYAINSSTGKLALASSLTTLAAVDGIAIDPHSKFVYVGNGGENDLAAVQVIQIGQGGKLSYISNVVFNGSNNPAVIPGASNCLLLSANGKFLFFTNQATAQVTSLNVDAQTGGLSLNSIASDGGGLDEPSQIAASPTRGLLFTGDFNTLGTPVMGVLRANANGTLKSLGTLPLTLQAPAISIAAVTF